MLVLQLKKEVEPVKVEVVIKSEIVVKELVFASDFHFQLIWSSVLHEAHDLEGKDLFLEDVPITNLVLHDRPGLDEVLGGIVGVLLFFFGLFNLLLLHCLIVDDLVLDILLVLLFVLVLVLLLVLPMLLLTLCLVLGVLLWLIILSLLLLDLLLEHLVLRISRELSSHSEPSEVNDCYIFTVQVIETWDVAKLLLLQASENRSC